MKKYRLGMVIAVMLAVIGFGTICSAYYDVAEKITVTVTDSVSNSIHKQRSVTAGLYYKETEEISMLQECQVQEVFVTTGELLEQDTPILQFKESDVTIQYLQKKLQAEMLENTKEEGTAKELTFWKLQNLQGELSVLEQILQNDYIMYADQSGILLQQPYKVGDMTSLAKRLVIAKPESGCCLKWNLSQEEYMDYRGVAFFDGKKVDISWEEPVYTDGRYYYSCFLPEVTSCVQGEPIEVELLYTSKEYRAVLPKRCIEYGTDAAPYIYQVYVREGMLGKEYYVKKIYVEILEQDDGNVAVSSPVEQVVERKSEQLSDLAEVLIIE